MDSTSETVLIVLLVVAAVVCVALAFWCWCKNYIWKREDVEHRRLTDESTESRGRATPAAPPSQAVTRQTPPPQQQVEAVSSQPPYQGGDPQKGPQSSTGAWTETEGLPETPKRSQKDERKPKSVTYGVVLKEDSGSIVGDVVNKFINSYNDVTKTPKLTQSGDVTVMSRPPSSLLIVPCLIQTRLLTDIERVVGASGVKSVASNQVLLVLHHKAPHDVYITPTRVIIGSTQVAARFQNNIIDVVFQNVGNANKLHRCEQNTTAVKELQRLVEGAKL